tara:strand:- start:55 stop:327 length:273 start_codon:yes stop_codon:yes gene_type:complete
LLKDVVVWRGGIFDFSWTIVSWFCNSINLFSVSGFYGMNIEELTVAFQRHEAQCDERWKTIFNRIQRIEHCLLAATGALLLLLASNFIVG